MIGGKFRREWEEASPTDRYHFGMAMALFGLPLLVLAVLVLILLIDAIL